MPKIQVNGILLYYEQHGWDKDADVLVLSNGVLMSTASWAMQVPVLAKHYRVLLYDCRGMWQSDHPVGPFSMNQHADDLAALLDALHIERAHIAGISYGGEISLIFGYRYPQRTRSIIASSAVSQVDPLLRGIIDSWIAAAQAAHHRSSTIPTAAALASHCVTRPGITIGARDQTEDSGLCAIGRASCVAPR